MTTIENPTDDHAPDNQSLEEQLAQAQAELADVQAQSADLDEQESELLSTIGDLEAWLSKITKSTDDYAAIHQELVDHDAACREYLAAETECLVSIIGDQADAIDSAVQGLIDEVEQKRQECNAAQEALDQALADQATAQEAADEAAATLDGLENITAHATDRRTAIDEVKAGISEAHNNQHYAVAYYHLVVRGELEEALDQPPELIPPDDLEAAITAAFDTKQAADEALLAADDAVADKQGAVDACNAELAELEAGLDAGIDDALKNIHPIHDDNN